MECFLAYFSRFFSTNVEIYLLGSQLATRNQIQAIKDIRKLSSLTSLEKFRIFLEIS